MGAECSVAAGRVQSETWLKFVFVSQCVSVAGGVVAHLYGLREMAALATLVAGVSAVGFVVLHGFCQIGGWRLAGFLTVAALFGFFAEVFSLHYGSLFGCAYHYPVSRWHDLLLGVPVSVAVFWGVFIYGSYGIVNGFLFFVGAEKPGCGRGGPLLIPLLSLADALVVTAIDIYMDPITTMRGSWIWAVPGPFFGVPIGNFVGWFAVSFAASGLFRTYEYLRPGVPASRSAFGHLMPGLSYLLLALVFTVYSCSIGRGDIALTGLFAMGPVAVLTLVCYAVSRTGIAAR